jgi:phosphate uptake regulator
MLKNLIEAFRGGDALREMLLRFDQMLDKAEWVFAHTSPENVSAADVEKVHEEIYASDRRINELERSIRYRVLTHLTVNPGEDASTCMMLMVVAKDAERIGDYCKNIFEVLQYCGAPRYSSMHEGELQAVRRQVEQMMPQTRQAFGGGDVVAAQQVIESAGNISQQTDSLVQGILRAAESPAKEPAAQVLLARHYKRVSSHLSNICSAITSPVDMLGYYDEGRTKKS